MKTKGMFTRIAPQDFPEKTPIPLGWAVISYRWVAEKSDRRRLHGKWVRIKSEYGSVYRVLRFSPTLEGSPSDKSGKIHVDWSAWLILNNYAEDAAEKSIELEIKEVGWWHAPWYSASHPDPTTRLSSRLGYLSFLLGILSIVLAFCLS